MHVRTIFTDLMKGRGVDGMMNEQMRSYEAGRVVRVAPQSGNGRNVEHLQYLLTFWSSKANHKVNWFGLPSRHITSATVS